MAKRIASGSEKTSLKECASGHPAGLSVEAIRQEVEKILGSPVFAHAERLSRFLRFATEEVVQGRGGRIKEFLIGLEVFERGSSFDPRTDPVVRVEARRLRSKLEEYYEDIGRDDPVVIELPRGTYRPNFRPGGKPAPRIVRWLNPMRWEMRPPLAASLAALVLLAVAAAVWILPLVNQQVRQDESRSGAARGTAADLSSIAVMPFVDLSAEKDLEYFCDGIAEELISALSRIPDLRVVSRTSAFQFKNGNLDARAIGERLGVGTLLEGSVRKAGGRLRINAQLICARDGYQLWSESGSWSPEDVFGIQDQIAGSVVGALKSRLGAQKGGALPVRSSTRNREAYNSYLKGRFLQNRRTQEGLQSSIQHFQQAISTDPRYALAYVGLADSHALLATIGVVPPRKAMPEAKTAALKAMEIDGLLGEAHATLAFIKEYWDWDWAGARAEYERAIQLSPGYATAYHWYAGCLRITGRLDEAIRQSEKAQELDPLSPAISRDLGRAWRWKRNYDRAIAEFRKALELDPGFSSGYVHLALAYDGKGMHQEALAALRKARELERDDPEIIGMLANYLGTHQDGAGAKQLLAELEALSKQRFVSPTCLAIAEIGIGDYASALASLEDAIKERDCLLTWLKMEPLFESMRPNPRFVELLGLLGLGN